MTKETTAPHPAWATVENEDDYHARSRSGEIMSSGMLRKFRSSPRLYHMAIAGQAKDKDTTACRFGRAVHKIVLEGIPAFNRSYAIGGPVNGKTGKCFSPGTKAFDAWLSENGLSMETVITQEEADALVAMANMAKRHAGAAAMLERGWPELVARADLHGVPCQARLDWLTRDEDGGLRILDLKTCDDADWFLSDARKYQGLFLVLPRLRASRVKMPLSQVFRSITAGAENLLPRHFSLLDAGRGKTKNRPEYAHQFAFYRDVTREASGVEAGFAVVSLEKREPFRVGVWTVPPETLDRCGSENRASLERFKQCRDSGSWPTGYEETRQFVV